MKIKVRSSYLSDRQLSLRAKGLASILLARGITPDVADITTDYDTEEEVSAALEELKACGYLVQTDDHLVISQYQDSSLVTSNSKNMANAMFLEDAKKETLASSRGSNARVGVREESEHKRMFGQVCTICGLDWEIMSKSSQGEIAKFVKKIRGAHYTPDHLSEFDEMWKKGWIYEQHKRPPTLRELEKGLGQVKKKVLIAKNGDEPVPWYRELGTNYAEVAVSLDHDLPISRNIPHDVVLRVVKAWETDTGKEAKWEYQR